MYPCSVLIFRRCSWVVDELPWGILCVSALDLADLLRIRAGSGVLPLDLLTSSPDLAGNV